MAWETRRNGKRYYYHAKKVGGRVVKTYCGNGPLAQAIDATERHGAIVLRELTRRPLREMQERYEPICQAVGAYCADVDAITVEVLTSAGCHRQKRGRWRKQRKKKEEDEMAGRTDKKLAAYAAALADEGRKPKPSPSRSAPIDPEVALRTVFSEGVNAQGRLLSTVAPASAEVADVLAAAKQGDESALPALRSFLDTLAKPGEPIPYALTSGAQLESLIIHHFFGAEKDLVAQECRKREYRAIRDEVAGPNPSPLEKLLAERIAVCWMHVQFCEGCYQSMMRMSLSGKGSQALTEYSTKKLDAAQKRYLQAIKTLAQVQRLKLPAAALQVNHVNIGGQHVHAETVALPG